jgi:hypothetical protein
MASSNTGYMKPTKLHKKSGWTIRYARGYGTFVLRNLDTLEEMYLDAPCRGDSEKLATQFLEAIRSRKVQVL